MKLNPFIQSHQSAWPRTLITAIIGILAFTAGLPFADADENATRDRRHRQLLDKRQQIIESFHRDLAGVSEWCQQHGLDDAIPEITQISDELKIESTETDLPRFVEPDVDSSLSADEQQWRQQIRHHREERASELYTLARSALRAGFPSLAFSIVGDVIRIDPDHKYARSVMGQLLFNDQARKGDRSYAGEWVSAFEKRRRSESPPQIQHPQFGWIPASTVARYEEGFRPWKGEWISAEKEAELRREFRNAWEIPSEHFLVKTNVSLEAGVNLSKRLERFHTWLQQNFAAFFDTPQSLRDRFEQAGQRGTPKALKPMEVHYYATREEYQRRVADKVPPNLETNGLYWQPDRTCYFYLNPAKDDFTTLYHEATHQILDVNSTTDRLTAARARARKLKQRQVTDWTLCENSGFWIIEGLACYFESFEVDEDGHVHLGNPEYVRFQTAQQRLLDPAFYFYMPAQQFFDLGKDEFQTHPQVSPLYTQASGYAHFLMHYDDGLYRDDLIRFLSAVYRPDPDLVPEDPSFQDIAGVSWDDLDHQYREHMMNLADQTQRKVILQPRSVRQRINR